jgi:Spy/CpxP family protein refolding chaperone
MLTFPLPNMKTSLLFLIVTASLLRAQAPQDPIGGSLFPPEFIMANAETIHFADEQRQAMQELMEKAQPQFTEMEQALRREGEALGQLLAQPAPGEAAVLAQFDKVQDRERTIKRAQFALMLGIREKLTAEQRTQLVALRAKDPGAQPSPATLQEKAGRVQNGVARWTEEGRDPSPIGELMNGIDPLLRAGKMREAEAVLDQALKLLGKDAK